MLAKIETTFTFHRKNLQKYSENMPFMIFYDYIAFLR